jgi:hypothetical protein
MSSYYTRITLNFRDKRACVTFFIILEHLTHLFGHYTSEFWTQQFTNCKHQHTRVNKWACGLVIAWTDDVPGIIITGLLLQPFVSLSGVMSCIQYTSGGGGGSSDDPPHSGVCAFRLQSTTGAVIKAAAAATLMHSLFNHTSRSLEE